MRSEQVGKHQEVTRVVCWFSCGVTSAVATKLCLAKYPNAVIAYCDTGSEHPDNERFIKDCERWFGKDIQRLKSPAYSDIWMERNLNAAICKTYAGDGKRKRVFLDELPPDAGRYEDLDITCGLFCGEQ